MSFQFDGEYPGPPRPQPGSRRQGSRPEEAAYREPAFAGDGYVQNSDGFPVAPEPAGHREPAPPSRPGRGPRPGDRERGGPPSRPSRGESARPPRGEAPRPSRGGPARQPVALTPRRVAGMLVAAIGLVVIALLVPSIVRSLRMDTIGGTVVAGSGARTSGTWQVSLVIPAQSQAVVFGARSAGEARVGLPVTISVPAAKISRVSGFIAQLTPRTASAGGGFTAVAQIRGVTRVIPSAGTTADVQLGS